MSKYRTYRGYTIAIDARYGNWHVYDQNDKYMKGFRVYEDAINFINNQDYYDI